MAGPTGREWKPATRLEAAVQGPPGQRTFLLMVETGDGSALLTIEKEQLHVLAMLVEQLLTGLPAVQVRHPGGVEGETEPPAGEDFPARADLEFRIVRLSLGIDQERDLFVLMAYASEEEPEGEPTLGCFVTRAQIRRLSRQITRLIAAGRPRCPLCQTPLDGGPHHCAGSNGHVAAPEPG